MPYKIVQTIEGKKIKQMTCPSGWEKNNILKYPKKGLFRYIHQENSRPEPDWDVMMCIVKRSNISSYDEGEKIITEMSNRSDTDEADSDNYPQVLYKNQAALNLNIVADKIVKPRRPQNKPTTLNLNNVVENALYFENPQENLTNTTITCNTNIVADKIVKPKPLQNKPTTLNLDNEAETMVENMLYIENPQENLENTTKTSATVLPQNFYVSYETNNSEVQETISIDIDKISENQKQMLEHQKQILDCQKQMLENQKQLIDSNTAFMGQTQTLIKIQNNVLQKLSGLSVQLEDAVLQITEKRNSDIEVQYLKDSKGRLENSPFSIKAIDSPKELDAIEKQLSDNNYKKHLKQTYSIVCSKGGKGVDCAYTLIDIMFTRQFICQCSWSGGSRGDNLKVPLKGYKQVLSFFWELIHFWDETFSLKDNENFFKTILKNAHKRKLAKCERASTSRKRTKKVTGEDESRNAEAEKENQTDNENEEKCEADEPKSEISEKRNKTDNPNNEETIEKQDKEDESENVTED